MTDTPKSEYTPPEENLGMNPDAKRPTAGPAGPFGQPDWMPTEPVTTIFQADDAGNPRSVSRISNQHELRRVRLDSVNLAQAILRTPLGDERPDPDQVLSLAKQIIELVEEA